MIDIKAIERVVIDDADTETVKLIIEIPKETYEEINEVYYPNNHLLGDLIYAVRHAEVVEEKQC